MPVTALHFSWVIALNQASVTYINCISSKPWMFYNPALQCLHIQPIKCKTTLLYDTILHLLQTESRTHRNNSGMHLWMCSALNILILYSYMLLFASTFLVGLQCFNVPWQCREMFSGTFCYYIYIYITWNSSGAPVTGAPGIGLATPGPAKLNIIRHDVSLYIMIQDSFRRID